MKPAENMIAILKANINNPMAMTRHLGEMADGMADVVVRIEALEKSKGVAGPDVGSKTPGGSEA